MKTIRHFIFFLCLSFAGLVWAGPVNINTADAETLATLNGIGPAKAQAIIEHRKQHGDFTDISQLVDVVGIGEKTLEKLKTDVTVK